MVQSGTAWCAVQSPYSTPPNILSDEVARAAIVVDADTYGHISDSGHQSERLASIVQPDRFRTTDVRASALNA